RYSGLCNFGMCPFSNNGVCDEPQGTGQCPPGTDFNDCNIGMCPFTNNGVCDEPQGTGQCPAGTDFNDCATMSCLRCADFISNGAQGTLCPESKLVFDNLLMCMCSGPCQVECGNNFCIDFKMVTMECQNCVNGPCSMEFATCANDI
ncbi:MAG TPA: hypothetical protein PK156_08570, partial [Polyangium sp.]|nr:hypothetical protein [Polyangium sp.]